METTVFQAHPEIIEKVFDALDSNTLLNCRLVCKTWNDFLENTNFWLKKLKGIGQPEVVELAWKNLIDKSNDKIEISIFAKCLRMKFTEFIRTEEKTDCLQKTRNAKILNTPYLNCPPLFTAAYFGIIDIVKLIYQLGEDCNRKIYLILSTNMDVDYYVMPIFAAIENGHTDIAKFFLETPQEQQKPSYSDSGDIPIMSAIKNKNLDLVKYLVPKTPNLNITQAGYGRLGLIHMAIRDYDILKYLVSQPGINPNLQNDVRKTALQMLCDDDTCFELKIPPGDVAKMIRILAPITDKEKFQSSYKSPLNIAACKGFVEALKALLEFFDPNEVDEYDQLPIDNAIERCEIEAIKILAPLTKDLNKVMIKHSRTTRKKSNALDVVQYFIDQRQGISESKIDKSPSSESNEPAQKKIRIELRDDDLYELPIENKLEVYTTEQIKSMIKLFKEKPI